MPDWEQVAGFLERTFAGDAHLNLGMVALQLAAAFAMGCIVAAIYHWTRRANATDPSLVPTLVLLAVLIAVVTLAIGDNQARAFSLVGALAIVRFRTVVEDTRDTAFVIYAVGVGLAAGAGFILVPLLATPFAAAAAYFFRGREAPIGQAPLDFNLTIRLGVGNDPSALLSEAFNKHVQAHKLIASGTARQGASLELTYRIRLQSEDGALALLAQLNGIQGIQGVEMRQA